MLQSHANDLCQSFIVSYQSHSLLFRQGFDLNLIQFVQFPTPILTPQPPHPPPSRWHPEIPSVAEVKEGDLFRVESIDWTGGQVSIWRDRCRHLVGLSCQSEKIVSSNLIVHCSQQVSSVHLYIFSLHIVACLCAHVDVHAFSATAWFHNINKLRIIRSGTNYNDPWLFSSILDQTTIQNVCSEVNT